MDRAISFLGQNWLGILLGIIGLGYAIYEARRHRGPKLSYQFIGQRIIGSIRDRLPGDLQVTYQQQPVQALSLTYLIVWNKGTAAVRRSDLSLHDPLRFSFGPQCRIFSAEVTKLTRSANRVSIAYDPGKSADVIIAFEFLDRNDGALISVWHESLDTMPDARGTIVGQTEGIVSFGRYIARSNSDNNIRRASTTIEQVAIGLNRVVRKYNRSLPFVLIAVGLLLAAMPHLRSFAPQLLEKSEPESVGSTVAKWGATAFGLLYAFTGVWLLRAIRNKFPKTLLPDEYITKKKERT